ARSKKIRDGGQILKHENLSSVPNFSYFATGIPFAAIRDSRRATVLGNESADPRPLPVTPFARSSGVLPLASFACRSAPFATRNSTKGLKPLSAAPCNAV